MKTSESIEQGEERKAQAKEEAQYSKRYVPSKKNPRGPYKGVRPVPDPNAKRSSGFQPGNVTPSQWKPGQSGNPLGNPYLRKDKQDVAKEIARAVFENNREALYTAFANAALKGNAYAFQQLADRAYGKLKEKVELEVTELHDVPTRTLEQQLADLEARLGYSRSDQLAGTGRQNSSRIIPASFPKED